MGASAACPTTARLRVCAAVSPPTWPSVRFESLFIHHLNSHEFLLKVPREGRHAQSIGQERKKQPPSTAHNSKNLLGGIRRPVGSGRRPPPPDVCQRVVPHIAAASCRMADS